jgi:hypothetical protein
MYVFKPWQCDTTQAANVLAILEEPESSIFKAEE